MIRVANSKAKGFDQRVLRQWRENLPTSVSVLVAVSGGVDSFVLADFLFRWRRLLKMDLAVAHVHHGPARGRQGLFRDQAQARVRRWAKRRDLCFFTNTPEKVGGVGEAAWRDYRWVKLRDWQREWGGEFRNLSVIATAHTAEDQMETQLLRLIRGTGLEGLRGMGWLDGDVVRPLALESKSTLLEVARKRRILWLEDPSNKSVDPLRNFLRRKWLEPLRQREVGALESLARSLNGISQSATRPEKILEPVVEGALDRLLFMQFSRVEQRRILAQYFRRSGVFHYTRHHLEEVLKRLDTGRREHKFELLGHRCEISADRIALRLE